jgi:AcrR family transcriptional regulator
MPRSAERTRRQILDAAYELFYRKGFSRVGVDEVAAFAGLTKRTFYYHFTSKDELLGSVLALHSKLSCDSPASFNGSKLESRALRLYHIWPGVWCAKQFRGPLFCSNVRTRLHRGVVELKKARAT